MTASNYRSTVKSLLMAWWVNNVARAFTNSDQENTCRLDLQLQSAAINTLAECNICGLMQQLRPSTQGHIRHCSRCGSSMGHGIDTRQVSIALLITGLILFFLANCFSLMSIEVAGRGQSLVLASSGTVLIDQIMWPLAAFVLLITVGAPVGRMLALGYVLLGAGMGKTLSHLRTAMRLADTLRPWAMLDVFLVGALVSLAKLQQLATVSIGNGFWALGFLILVVASLEASIDSRAIWNRLMPPGTSGTHQSGNAMSGCHGCGMVQSEAHDCTRCGARFHRRKPNSLEKSLAYMISALALYVPANLFPVLTVISFGKGSPATILEGVVELMDGSDWPLALIIFIASVAVPLLKLVGLGVLITTTHLNMTAHLMARTRLFQLIEMVSRWSTVDIFVAGLLTALVSLGKIATIEPGLGVFAFGGVVVLTMMATESFDSRIMWDKVQLQNG